jgi:hypothetical protein
MLVRRCVRLNKWLCRRGMIPIRDIERGEEIQEGKARCPGAKEGDEDGEAGKKGYEETRSETRPGSDRSITASAPATVCSGTANRRGHDWSIDTGMSALGGKADMAFCGISLSRSLLGVKRTWLVAAHMSAFDPKRTSGRSALVANSWL